MKQKTVLIVILLLSIIPLILAAYFMLKGIAAVDAFSRYPTCEVLLEGDETIAGDDAFGVYAFNFEDKLEAIPIPICLAGGELAGLAPGTPPEQIAVLPGYRVHKRGADTV